MIEKGQNVEEHQEGKVYKELKYCVFTKMFINIHIILTNPFVLLIRVSSQRRQDKNGQKWLFQMGYKLLIAVHL